MSFFGTWCALWCLGYVKSETSPLLSPVKMQPRIPPPYWPPFRWSDISEYWIFCDVVILDGITTPSIFLEALNGPLRCRRRFFFPEKWPPYFWKPWMSPYVAAGAFFFSRKMAPIFLEALDEPLRCRRRFFFPEKWSLDFWGDSQMDLDLDISSL